MKPYGLLVVVAGFCLPATAQVQKWTDSQGQTHYGDRPPAGAGAKSGALRGTVSLADGFTVVRPPPGNSSPTDAPATAPALPAAGQIWIYTTPTCGYCRRAKEHMRLKGIAFVEKDVTANAANQREFSALGGRGVPLTLSHRGRINGYSEANFESFLKSAGF